jgi:hypothetical protein
MVADARAGIGSGLGVRGGEGGRSFAFCYELHFELECMNAPWVYRFQIGQTSAVILQAPIALP